MAQLFISVFITLPIIFFRHSSAECVHQRRDDLLEYSCTGGSVTDLNNVPENVEQLKISRMRIPIITPHTFSRFSESLLVLKCSECDISDIEVNAFSHLSNLQQLSLDGNKLTSLKASWIQGVKDLTFLDLSYNQIENIEDEAFKYLTGVTDLRLSGNRLKCINLDALSQMESLSRIFLKENPDFQCPNAVSRYFEDRNVLFERDESWSAIPQDLMSANNYEHQDYWKTRRPYFHSSTIIPAYLNKIIIDNSRRYPGGTDSPWTSYSQTEKFPWSTSSTESEIPRRVYFDDDGQYNTQQSHSPSMDRGWMNNESPRHHWSSEKSTQDIPRTPPTETPTGYYWTHSQSSRPWTSERTIEQISRSYPTERNFDYSSRSYPTERDPDYNSRLYPTERDSDYSSRSYPRERDPDYSSRLYSTEKNRQREEDMTSSTPVVFVAGVKGLEKSVNNPDMTNTRVMENYSQEEVTTISNRVGAGVDEPDCGSSSSVISGVMGITLLSVILSVSRIILRDGL